MVALLPDAHPSTRSTQFCRALKVYHTSYGAGSSFPLVSVGSEAKPSVAAQFNEKRCRPTPTCLALVHRSFSGMLLTGQEIRSWQVVFRGTPAGTAFWFQSSRLVIAGGPESRETRSAAVAAWTQRRRRV